MDKLYFYTNQTLSDSEYLQLANQIIRQIKKGELTLGENLPPVNKLVKELNISRETIFRTLNHLSDGITAVSGLPGFFKNPKVTVIIYDNDIFSPGSL